MAGDKESIAMAVYHLELLRLQLERIEAMEMKHVSFPPGCLNETRQRMRAARAAIDEVEQHLGLQHGCPEMPVGWSVEPVGRFGRFLRFLFG